MKILTEEEINETVKWVEYESDDYFRPHIVEIFEQAVLVPKLIEALKFYRLEYDEDKTPYDKMDEDEWGGRAREILKLVEK